MAYKKIKPAPVRTKDAEVNKAIDLLIKALEQIYMELDRLEKTKQDA